jgi:hypothetical protein
MTRLDRNESMTLMRILVKAQRETSHEAIDLARLSLKNDRQFEAFQKVLRGIEKRQREEALSVAQSLGIIDFSVTADDLRTMR